MRKSYIEICFLRIIMVHFPYKTHLQIAKKKEIKIKTTYKTKVKSPGLFFCHWLTYGLEEYVNTYYVCKFIGFLFYFLISVHGISK